MHYDRVLLLITDAAPYMKKAGEVLMVTYPNMIHVTCLCHALHRIAEHVRIAYPNVDKLVANGKKIFLKSPSRMQLYREASPDVPFPPQPVITRWGTWLTAVFYYAEHWETFKTVVESFDPEEASSVKIVQKLFKEPTLLTDILFITTHFKKVPDVITALEARNIPIYESLKLFDDLIASLCIIPGSNGEAIKIKCENVLKKKQRSSRFENNS